MSTPASRRAANPGKHEPYVFGQSSADGTACVGCDWQTYLVLNDRDAVARHDADRGVVHNHREWIHRVASNGWAHCPCGANPYSALQMDKLVDSALEAFRVNNQGGVVGGAEHQMRAAVTLVVDAVREQLAREIELERDVSARAWNADAGKEWAMFWREAMTASAETVRRWTL